MIYSCSTSHWTEEQREALHDSLYDAVSYLDDNHPIGFRVVLTLLITAALATTVFMVRASIPLGFSFVSFTVLLSAVIWTAMIIALIVLWKK